jgi:hypothetical protein
MERNLCRLPLKNMIYKLSGIIALGLIVMMVGSLSACRSEPLAAPAQPTLETKSPSPVITATTSFTSTAPESGITVDSDEALVEFPDKIIFSIKGQSSESLTAATLEYGTDERTLVPQENKTQAEFTEGSKVDASWTWQMKKLGSIPPGATIWWQWKFSTSDGKEIEVPKQEQTYSDPRFSWEVSQLSGMDLYWSGQPESLKNELISGLEGALSRIPLETAIPSERKPKIFIYHDSEELRGAMLHEQEWIGAVAFTTYNIILTAVDENNLDWAKGALPHEITHLLVEETVFGPFGQIPTWLNEGIAEYSKSQPDKLSQEIFNDAYKNRKLISLQSLASAFPTDATQAYLAYAESESVVAFMLDTYGWPKMRQLLQVFKEGTTYDDGLKQVYSVDTKGLEALWKDYLAKQ